VNQRSALPVDRFAVCWYGGLFALLAVQAHLLREPGLSLVFFGGVAGLWLVFPIFAERLGYGRSLAVRVGLYCFILPLTFEMVGRIVLYISPDRRDSWLLHLDRILFGSDPTRWTGGMERFPLVSEILMWVYSSFYFLPVVLAVRLGMQRKLRAIEQSLLVVVAGFLISYLGYILVPARSPYRLYPYPFELHGVWMFDVLRRGIWVLEAARCDAFPSGHSDVTWLVAALAWRHDRRSFYWFFGPIAVLLPIGTVYLRYHYGVDVLAGAFFAIVTWRMCMALERAAGRPE
jgi:membrane-associated phospholipid phosphatase